MQRVGPNTLVGRAFPAVNLADIMDVRWRPGLELSQEPGFKDRTEPHKADRNVQNGIFTFP
jgi:hypothetical protein